MRERERVREREREIEIERGRGRGRERERERERQREIVLSDFLEPGDESKIAESVDDHEHDVGTVKETEVSEELAVNEKTVHLGPKWVFEYHVGT